MKRLFPWLALVAGGAALAAFYPSFPERWPIHWDAHGQINGWTDKSPLGAAFPLLLGAAFTLLFELVAWAAGQARRVNLPAPWPERLAQANRNYLYSIATVLNLFFGYLACTLPHGPPGLWAPVLLVLGTIAYPAYDFYRLSQEMRKDGAWPRGYQGLVYSNPDDPRIWVPKISGYGLTLNFAHARARWLLAAIMLLPLTTVWALFYIRS